MDDFVSKGIVFEIGIGQVQGPRDRFRRFRKFEGRE